MREESKWIEDNIVSADRGEIRAGLKKAIQAKTNAGQKLEKEIPVTGDYKLLGFTIKELGKTAQVMFGYDEATASVYEDYLAIALSDRLKEEYKVDTISLEDYDKLKNYGKMVMEELKKLCTKEVYYTLIALYKVFK